nr:hypothetical protein [Streptomyces sp. TLI_235]
MTAFRETLDYQTFGRSVPRSGDPGLATLLRGEFGDARVEIVFKDQIQSRIEAMVTAA